MEAFSRETGSRAYLNTWRGLHYPRLIGRIPLLLGMILFSQRKYIFLKIVNTGELPTSECNQYAKGILTVDMQTKTEQKAENIASCVKTSKVVMQNQTFISIHVDTKSQKIWVDKGTEFAGEN